MLKTNAKINIFVVYLLTTYQQQINQLQEQVQALQHENQGFQLLPVVSQLHASQTEVQQVQAELNHKDAIKVKIQVRRLRTTNLNIIF